MLPLWHWLYSYCGIKEEGGRIKMFKVRVAISSGWVTIIGALLVLV